MYCKEPHKRSFWRLVEELVEDGVLEEDSEVEESSESEDDWGLDTVSEFDDEEDWVMEQIIFGEEGDNLYE